MIQIFAFLFVLYGTAFASSEMNGYTLEQFGDFEKNWQLVTVRYRKDTGELRFTYANDLAWNTLKNNSLDYPDGSVFAKIGIATQEDPIFPSSAVPSGARRTQFMVRNKSLHKDRPGYWEYALFDAKGNLFPGDVKNNTLACVACHNIAKEREYVFSQIMGDKGSGELVRGSWKQSVKFVDQKIGGLPITIRSILSAENKSVRKLTGPIAEHVFFGTLDEVRPLLSQETLENGKPSVLVSKDGKSFSMVARDSSKTCANNEVALVGIHSLPEKDKTMRIPYCATKTQ